MRCICYCRPESGFQQRIDELPFADVLRAKSNRLSDLRSLVPSFVKALPGLLPGESDESRPNLTVNGARRGHALIFGSPSRRRAGYLQR
jgi:hypothetical protein